MKVFITGNSLDGLIAAEAFSLAEAQLTAEGYEVLNPLRTGLPSESAPEAKAAVNILQLLSCDAIYLLPDWQSDTLAVIEKNIAVNTGKLILQEIAPQPDIKQIIEDVMGVSFDDIRGRSRNRTIVYARQIYAHYARENGGSLIAIGMEMEHNHTSVLYYLRKYADDYAYTKEFRKYANDVNAELQAFLRK